MTGSEVFGFIIGAVLATIVWTLVMTSVTSVTNDTALRALSCMGNGNSIAQCEVVLGLKVHNN